MFIRIKQFRIHIICIIMTSLFCAINFSFHTPILFLSIFIHESGHILMLKKNKIKINYIEVLPVGININTENKLLSYKEDIKTAFAGPFFNIVCAFLALLFLKFIYFNDIVMFFLISNLAYAAINLFPVKSLDGGKIVETLLRIYLPEPASFYLFTIISGIFFSILSLVALLILFITKYNFTLILLCCYLFYTIHFSFNPKKR